VYHVFAQEAIPREFCGGNRKKLDFKGKGAVKKCEKYEKRVYFGEKAQIRSGQLNFLGVE